jgi:hypothetical protein
MLLAAAATQRLLGAFSALCASMLLVSAAIGPVVPIA